MSEKFEELMANLPLPVEFDPMDLVESGEITFEECEIIEEASIKARLEQDPDYHSSLDDYIQGTYED